MREFEDAEGRRWDVVVGRESWGSFFAIFVARDGTAPPRQTLLSAASNEEAVSTLERLNQAGLEDIFRRSQIKELG